MVSVEGHTSTPSSARSRCGGLEDVNKRARAQRGGPRERLERVSPPPHDQLNGRVRPRGPSEGLRRGASPAACSNRAPSAPRRPSEPPRQEIPMWASVPGEGPHPPPKGAPLSQQATISDSPERSRLLVVHVLIDRASPTRWPNRDHRIDASGQRPSCRSAWRGHWPYLGWLSQEPPQSPSSTPARME
jgi:hypothetical protein